MGKAEVREQLYVFLERGTEYAFEELRPLSIAGPSILPGNGAIKLLLRRVIDENVKEVELGLKNELTLVMDYAEERAWDENADAAKYRRKFLKSDIFFRHYEGDRQDELEDALVRHFEEMAHDMTPLIRTDADDFWEAMREEYDKYEAEEILRHHFSFVEGVVDEFGDGLEMKSSLGPVGIDYTQEALRILPTVETRIRREVVDEIDDAYGSRYEAVGSSELSGEAYDEISEKGSPESESSTEDDELERLRERVKELEEEKEELREELEEKRSGYEAEDWLS